MTEVIKVTAKSPLKKVYTLNNQELDLEIRLVEPGANCDIKIAAETTEKTNIKVRVFHDADNTASDLLVKVLAKDGETRFKGLIEAPKERTGIKAKQIHKALMLSDTAKVYADPDLKIYTEDAEAEHGSAIGAFDEKTLFYLMTRGFSLNGAKTCLSNAFLKEITG